MKSLFGLSKAATECTFQDLNYASCVVFRRNFRTGRCLSQIEDKEKLNFEEEQFRVIDLVKKRLPRKMRKNQFETFFKQPREEAQSVTQDWGSVWPGIRSFQPATVPLPIRMGMPNKGQPIPDKWGNAELMKIPNFLHLTPPVVKKQCEALKKFCTPWPEDLSSEEAQNHHFTVSMKSDSYLQSLPSLRDPRSRVVSYTVLVDSLKLDDQAKDKLLRLVGDRFDPETGTVTLVSDRCPLQTQNFQYCEYLLTVLYKESKKREPWEETKDEYDFESFSFERSSSKDSIEFLKKERTSDIEENDVHLYEDIVTELHNEGENEEMVEKYGEVVKKMLKLSST